MTITIKSKTVNKHYISIRQSDNAPGYDVSIYQVQDINLGLCGYPIDTRHYKTLKGACNRYEKLIENAQ